jgi:hypothetical protein
MLFFPTGAGASKLASREAPSGISLLQIKALKRLKMLRRLQE